VKFRVDSASYYGYQTNQLLQRVFPKWSDDPRQYEQRRRWSTAIKLYFIKCTTTAFVAKKLGISAGAALSLIRNIRRARQGRAARDGKVHTVKTGKRGRDRQPRRRPAKSRAIK
jgi:hypothetical protein